MIPAAPHPPRAARQLGAVAALGALSLMGCHDLNGFSSKDGQAYCGTIGLAALQDGFVKDDSPPDLQLALTLNMSQLTSEPGFLTSNDPTGGLCGDTNRPQELFQNAPLRAIPAVDHDVLSTLSFGEGHEHDFFVWVDSSCQGTMLGVVSLLKNNLVELRLFKPARLPPPNATAAERPGFALFHLDAKPLYKKVDEGGCGFPPP